MIHNNILWNMTRIYTHYTSIKNTYIYDIINSIPETMDILNINV